MTLPFAVQLPVLAAPMAGGPSTPALVIEAARTGSLGFLAAGYKTPQDLADQIDTVSAASVSFGVNLFVPNPLPIDQIAYQRYADLMRAEADRYGITIGVDRPVEDDDHWRDKIDVLRSAAVPVISLTFGIPDARDVQTLRRTGAVLVQTVTSVAEAEAAAEVGVDALAVQSAAAGGHSGTLTPRRPLMATSTVELVAAVRSAVRLPVLAAGWLATPADVADVVRAGADAVVVGTALLRSHEAGTSATHRAALADMTRTGTTVTHAFTGRPARGLRNEFIDTYETVAPYGYPALHHLTTGIRKAAAAAGDPERVHLWAGTGYRLATDEPAAAILNRLASGL